MGNINDGGPAFPVPMVPWKDGFINVECAGMSLRDWLAGLCSGNLPFCPDQVSRAAYGYADAMIAAREASNGN